jgi:hypothetical protein
MTLAVHHNAFGLHHRLKITYSNSLGPTLYIWSWFCWPIDDLTPPLFTPVVMMARVRQILVVSFLNSGQDDVSRIVYCKSLRYIRTVLDGVSCSYIRKKQQAQRDSHYSHWS